MGANSSKRNESSRGNGLPERYFLGFVLFVTAITYTNSLRFAFVYDDDAQIPSNPFIRSWQSVPQYFTGLVWKHLFPIISGNSYRPLFLLWIRANYAIFGIREVGWHASAVLLHVLVTGLVFYLVKKLTGRFTVAWITALIFGVHPIHHEVVAWASGSAESLFAALFLAAFLAYWNSREKSKTIWMIVSAVLYGLALLCAETALILPIVVFAFEWVANGSQDQPDRPDHARRFARALLPLGFYVPIAAIYLIARTRALSGLSHAAPNSSVYNWLLTLPSILVFYVKNWLFPVRLSEFYDLFYQSSFNLKGVVLPAVALIAIAAALWVLRKPLGVQATIYAAIWLLIPLLPALYTFAFRSDELVHDRYFYLPSVGASMLLALVVDRAFAGQHTVLGQPSRVVGAALALAAVLGLCAAREASSWSDDYTLYSRGRQIAPLNSTAMNNLGAEMLKRQEIDASQELFESGHQRYPGDDRFAFNLGRLSYGRMQYPKAEEFASEAIRLNPISADSFVLLGQAQLRQGRKQQALQSFQHAVELNPYDATFHSSYGVLLKMNGDCAAANSQFAEALAIEPGYTATRLQMTNCQASLAPSNNSGTKSSQP
jgi:tetratricopeptide (TPR) repeat protein